MDSVRRVKSGDSGFGSIRFVVLNLVQKVQLQRVAVNLPFPAWGIGMRKEYLILLENMVSSIGLGICFWACCLPAVAATFDFLLFF